jgi:ribonuclease HI
MTKLLDEAIAALAQLSESEQDAIARLILEKVKPGKTLVPSTFGTPVIERIYTDGACSGNPGPGGWGTVVYFSNGAVHEMGGGDRQTTNNRMEMQAAIAALQYLKESGQTQAVELYTDSEYVKNGITKWIAGWKKKGWKTSTGKPVLNQDLWERLDALNSRQVEWRYVRGHAGNEGNERCDAIARAFSLGRSPQLRQL